MQYGGIRINEPSIDLGIILSVCSSYKNKPIEDGVIVIGEVGLTGEVRRVSMIEKQLKEAEKYKKSGYIVCKTTNEGYRYGYISNSGDKLLDTNYNNIKRVIDIQGQDIYIIASSNGQYGLIKNKETLIDFKYQGIEYNATNNLLIINRGAKYGVYTLTGEEIVPIDYKTLQLALLN